ncbi:methyltransferase [bacterium]|nr:methyltransferase [bacterium]
MDPRQHLSELGNTYQGSVVLLTACRLDLFEALGRESRTVSDLARASRLDARALEVVLLALVAEGVLQREGESAFRVTPEYLPFLLKDSPETMINILRHSYSCLRRWVQLDDVLGTGHPVPREDRKGQEMQDFIRGMADISRASSEEVARKLDLSPFRRMIDVGGGPGSAAIAFARHNPDLRATVFDLPGPLEIAREEIEEAGLADRIDTRPGDYFKNELGEGFDLAYLSNIIHSMSPDDTRNLLAKIHRALVPGGTIVIKDFFLDENRTSPRFGAYFSVNMLVGTEKGKSYTQGETRDLLEEAGFQDFRTLGVATASGLIIGTRKG